MNTCRHCQQSFPTPRRHPHQKYCSTACRDIARNTCIELPCSCCGKPVNRSRSRATQAHVYCSKACEVAWRKQHGTRGETHVQHIPHVTIPCDTCGTMLSRQPSRVRPHNFCNPACRLEWQRISNYMSGPNSPTWKGGHSDYRGPNWRRQSKAVKNRDNYTCRHCGATDGLQAHHIEPFVTFASYLEANALDNLITLCLVCHKTAEWEYWRTHPDFQRMTPKTQLIHVCDSCGKEYQPKGQNSKRCNECWKRTCRKCGKVFRPRLWHEENKYCSRLCAGTSKAALSASNSL